MANDWSQPSRSQINSGVNIVHGVATAYHNARTTQQNEKETTAVPPDICCGSESQRGSPRKLYYALSGLFGQFYESKNVRVDCSVLCSGFGFGTKDPSASGLVKDPSLGFGFGLPNFPPPFPDEFCSGVSCIPSCTVLMIVNIPPRCAFKGFRFGCIDIISSPFWL